METLSAYLKSDDKFSNKLKEYIRSNMSFEEHKQIMFIIREYYNKIDKKKDFISDSYNALLKNLKSMNYENSYYWKRGLMSTTDMVAPKTDKNIDTSLYSFIIVNRDGTELNRIIKNINEVFTTYNKEIIIVNQEDNDLFKRGQLFNIGVSKCNGKYLVLLDNDIINFNNINFIETYKEVKHPFCLFDMLTQITYINESEFKKTSKYQCFQGFGGCLFIPKEIFVKNNGYSNLCFGWGSEDNIGDYRFGGIKRVKQEIGHITHPTRSNKNKLNTSLNHEICLKHYNGYIDKTLDGYDQTCFDTTYDYTNDDVRFIGVKNIRVPLDFKYIDLYNKQVELSKIYYQSDKTCIVIPLLNETPDKYEAESFKRALTVFKNRKVFTVCKQGFNLDEYKKIESETNGAKIFNYFMPEKNMINNSAINEMYKTYGFYSLFKNYNYMLLYDLKSLALVDNLDYFTSKNYDYVGALHFEKENGKNIAKKSGDGSATLRKVSKMLELCKKYASEDRTISDYEFFVEKHGSEITMCHLKDAMKFSFNDEPATCFLNNEKKFPMIGSNYKDYYDAIWHFLVKFD